MTAQELVEKLATFTDPRVALEQTTEEISEELEAFAGAIRQAKEIVGDLSPEIE